jgi:hypothetical protein
MILTAHYAEGDLANPRCVLILSKQESGGSEYRLVWADFGKGGVKAAVLPVGEEVGLGGDEFESLRKAVVCSVAGLYYRIELPPAGGELDSIVRMQAESVVPFSGDGMEVCWRVDDFVGEKDSGAGGGVRATIAACRSEAVGKAADVMGEFGVHCSMLSQEAVAAGWYRFYGPVAERGVLVYFNSSNVSVILCEGGKLINSVSFYSELAGKLCSDDIEPSEAGGNYRLFIQDLCGAVERLGEEAAGLSLFIVCPEAGRFESVREVLRDSDVDVELSVFDKGSVDVGSCGGGFEGEIGEVEFFELLSCAGAAAKQLDGEEVLDVFEDFNRRGESSGSTKLSRTVIKYAAAFLAIGIIFVFTNYCLERAELGQIRELIYDKNADQSEKVFSEKEQLRRLIASDRAGVMGLLGKVVEAAPKGVLLDSFDMSRGRQISVKGRAGSYEMVFEFQDKLSAQNSVENAELRNPTFDEKSKKVSFEMYFDYKNFSKRK